MYALLQKLNAALKHLTQFENVISGLVIRHAIHSYFLYIFKVLNYQNKQNRYFKRIKKMLMGT